MPFTYESTHITMEIMPSVKEITILMKVPTEEDTAIITKAYYFAEQAHEGQKRLTGEPFFYHLFETGKNLAVFGVDARTIVAGLIHDTLEDGKASAEEIEKQFGAEVLFLVEGVTKLGKLKYHGIERHVESLRKLFIATAHDVRVIIIKLADRLHNIQTLSGHTNHEKQKRIALETLEIYAPIAHRLGMGKLRGELEDGAFPFVYPKEYEEVKTLLKQRSKVDEKYLNKVHRSIQKEISKQNIRDKVIRTDRRIKRIYSLYKKLLRYDMDIEKIHDIVALRVIVATIEDCYRILGVIHGMWRPLPGKIKDYIAVPKQNGYQSLHTTVFTGDGGMVEIQIRTEEMHNDAEYGVAAHVLYKDGLFTRIKGGNRNVFKKKPRWVTQLLEWQSKTSRPDEFIETLRVDFFQDRVFVFTPKGDVVDLPDGSGVIDFAYAIHSDIGNHISGVKVNDKFVSLDTKLRTDDIIEIETKKTSRPTAKWLEYAKTTLAKRHIRSLLSETDAQQEKKLFSRRFKRKNS
ncbi:MAG: hypothetical protein COZ49_01345 [Candidatus Yonathbacteria bacterium CG_4_10_14_3_um_filter_47_65]|uniref:TGS domain-containing protein n=2 Tax=Parcubacteria group TaxID=1794811 RepID=A0A2M8D6W9_9BACT|nr:MAG: hypothetical protein COX54_00965 [Candidatus Yonathbacteria bacterium CG23_combo_of_CG06-09_8_20_14_all_46_18]PIQ30973.1 MAG: hypothetical protein COW61_04530 [Candidatus Yonathbacteria bacterium CG17_big_fil_post_rev_8_21_14_2_50_46_19]PIX56608.1 MAG: hypothetical protein COZ49_01345 [Candidatus Yonathbacteria bacterium CG_4_10_14_3_um_filter_47_65]PIY57264.1 MAG: hypothetical protein COY99_04210 [Candidatus Yonathbacteria bacterium CG_4_10_14_0_8_um_filter_47_645]PJB82802.1 MAG: hypot